MNEYPYFNPYAPYMPMQNGAYTSANQIQGVRFVSNRQEAENCGIPRISPYGYGVVPNFATPCGCGCNGATF
jgi:hypothetical protein